MNLDHIKKQFELVKDTETFAITTETVRELIEHAEKAERYEKVLNSISEGKTEKGMEVNRIWLMRMAKRVLAGW